MDYVEIIGPPGSGKTTIIKELALLWRPSFNWDVVSPDGVKKHRSIRFRNFVKRVAFKLIPRKIIPPVYSNSERNLLYLYAQKNKKFFDFYWETVKNNHHDSFLAMDAFRWLSQTTEVVSRINNSKKMGVTCLDEGFIHRFINLYPACHHSSNSDCNHKEIKEFLKFAPKPKGVVLIETPTEVIKQRYLSRHWTLSLYHDQNSVFNPDFLAAEEQRTILLTEILRNEYQTLILKLPGLDNPKKNALKIKLFLEAM
jgi:energy-coupling factor transporter ATP-binding protein EcfA2